MSAAARRTRKTAVAARRRASAPPPEVEAVFRACPKELQPKLRQLRRLILETAAATAGVGPLEEALKWGQPSYLTTASKSGSMVRIDQVKSTPGHYAIYFHCQTDLVATFRELYPDAFSFGGNRSILFSSGDAIPQEPLRHCIALALTYRLRKRARARIDEVLVPMPCGGAPRPPAGRQRQAGRPRVRPW